MDGRVAEPDLPDPTELLEFIDSLSEALESHYDWLWASQRALVCTGETSAPVHCRLDHWLQGKARVPPHASGAVALVEERHRIMHRATDDLLTRTRDGERVPAVVYDSFLNARKAFKDAALQLERVLWNSTCLLDALTGLRNRHGMLMELREEQQRSLRDGRTCTLAMMDIDHFKAINDHHGHPTGDAVLRAVARRVSRRLRPYDRIYRYGGEEFLLCLPDTDSGCAAIIIERVREEIAEASIRVGDRRIRLTVSFGLAPLGVEESVDQSIERADAALLSAKVQGRNRVVAVG